MLRQKWLLRLWRPNFLGSGSSLCWTVYPNGSVI